jgi:hypothetical protein
MVIAAGETMEFFVEAVLDDYEDDGDSFQLKIANGTADVSWDDGEIAASDILVGLIDGLPLTGGTFVNPS